MTRIDMIKFELFIAANYEREAKSRRSKNPKLADEMMVWSSASRARAEKMRSGPLFGHGGDQ